MAKVKTSNSGRRYVEIEDVIKGKLHPKPKVCEQTKKAIEGAMKEIVAGSILRPFNDQERAWNDANARATRILSAYLKGEGLFQL